MRLPVHNNCIVAPARTPPTSPSFFFFFNDTATTEIYTLSLHDALPISVGECFQPVGGPGCPAARREHPESDGAFGPKVDRKSTRLNSSHLVISYAVFCLKKKKEPPPHKAPRMASASTSVVFDMTRSRGRLGHALTGAQQLYRGSGTDTADLPLLFFFF